MLNEIVIPNAKAQAGFEKGTWMQTPDNAGMGVVVFDTIEHAEAAQDALKPPPGGPTLISCTIYRIGAEA